MHGFIELQSENFETSVIEPIDKEQAIYEQFSYFDSIEYLTVLENLQQTDAQY